MKARQWPSVKQYLDGLKLYDQFWSGYGPVYYFYNWLLRSITGTPVTHDVVRISALLPWLVTSLVCAWIILRVTDSLVLATLAHLLTLYSLQFFAVEPGHPQELCILLLVCFVASGISIGQKRHFLSNHSLGALPAALLLIKVNLGIFAILAIGLSLSFHARENWLSKTFRSFLCSREPISAVCADEASAGRSSGTSLLRSIDRFDRSVQPNSFLQQ